MAKEHSMNNRGILLLLRFFLLRRWKLFVGFVFVFGVLVSEIKTKWISSPGWKAYRRRQDRLKRESKKAIANYSASELPCHIKKSCPWPPALTVSTVAFGLPDSYVKALRDNHERYGDHFCYEVCVFTNLFDATRPPAWSKIPAVRHLFDHGRREVASVDSDAIFINSFPFEHITSPFWAEGKDIVFSSDLGPEGPVYLANSSINSAVFVSKNTVWSRQFWRRIYNDFPETIFHHWWEQQAVLTFRDKYTDELVTHAGVVEHRAMNLGGWFEKPEPNTFVYHAGGGHNDHKYAKLQSLMEGLDLGKQIGKQIALNHVQ